jgi:uncharacterized LabA/DUF88 family protein
MIFIDGGYLRGLLEKRGKKVSEVDFPNLFAQLMYSVSATNARVHGELIRAFYYDANVPPETDLEEHRRLDAEFEALRKVRHFQLRMGRLIKTAEGRYRQKGTDVLLAIDMITKAYEGQYEIAILLAGDDDFLDVVNTVKDKGRRVYGSFEEASVSKRLADAFDLRIPLEWGRILRLT